WELIKLPDAVPIVLAQRVEELEGLDQMHRADDHVVVPAAEVVVDVDRKQTAGIDAQLRRIGRCLEAVHGVTEVQQDAEIVQTYLLNSQQRTGRIWEDDLIARLPRLVLDHELDLRMGRDELTEAIDRQLPDVVVVHLERIVPAVLAEPQLDVVAAELPGQFGGLMQ